jgi:hypothetical protein
VQRACREHAQHRYKLAHVQDLTLSNTLYTLSTSPPLQVQCGDKQIATATIKLLDSAEVTEGQEKELLRSCTGTGPVDAAYK